MRTHIDYLVLGPFLLEKAAQPEWKETGRLATGVSARLTPAEGRKFGLLVGGAFLVLAAIFWRGSHSTLAWIAGCLGGGLVVGGALAPGRLGPVYAAWMALALAISKITTPVFMGIMFFLVSPPPASWPGWSATGRLSRVRTPTRTGRADRPGRGGVT